MFPIRFLNPLYLKCLWHGQANPNRRGVALGGKVNVSPALEVADDALELGVVLALEVVVNPTDEALWVAGLPANMSGARVLFTDGQSQVAREVLPDAEYKQWVDDLVVEVNLLRGKFGIKPHLIAEDYY